MKSKTVVCGFKKGEILIFSAKTNAKKSIVADELKTSELKSINKINESVAKIMNQLEIKS